MRRWPLYPTECLESKPTSKTIRLGGRFISLTKIAEHGFDAGYLSYIFSGDRVPSVPYAMRLAKTLGLFTEEREPDVNGLFTLISQHIAEEDADRKRKLA